MTKGDLPETYKVIPDEHYAAIGRAVVTWADLEFTVDRTIWRLLGKEQAVGACLTAQYNSVFSKLSALISMIDLFDLSGDALKGLRKLQGALSSLSEQRNRIVHDARFQKIRDQTIGRYQVTARSSLNFSWRHESFKTLNSFATRWTQTDGNSATCGC
jgi:hypothetical protein